MIELRGITKTFILGDSRVNAVDGVDLDIGRGEYISIMGPSGSGKSTLLNLVALLDRPTAGTYVFDSRDVVGLDDDELAAIRRQAIGFIFQFFHLIPRLTAAQNVELPLTLAGVDPAQRQTRVHAVLERIDLVDRATHRPAELSGRQRQRVAIAIAFIGSLRFAVPGLPLAVLWPFVALALILSIAIGIISGLLPALRAAAMDPVEALRAE